MSLVKSVQDSVSDDYLELVKAFPLRTIRSDREHSDAVKILTRLLGRTVKSLSAGERDYVEVLGHLINGHGYGKSGSPRKKQPPLELLRFLLRENAMTTADLGRVLGNKTAASLVINGRRALSKAHIRKLAERFKVDPGLFFD